MVKIVLFISANQTRTYPLLSSSLISDRKEKSHRMLLLLLTVTRHPAITTTVYLFPITRAPLPSLQETYSLRAGRGQPVLFFNACVFRWEKSSPPEKGRNKN